MTESKRWFELAESKGNIEVPGDHIVNFAGAVLAMLCPSHTGSYPDTFVLDEGRLVNLRSDIKRAIALEIATLLFQGLTLQFTPVVHQEAVCKLRTSILALCVEENDSAWMQNPNNVALHVLQSAHEFNRLPGIPDHSMVTLAERWLCRHLCTDSPIYDLVESRVLKKLKTIVVHNIHEMSLLPILSVLHSASDPISSPQLNSIAKRASDIIFIHWEIFGKMYLSRGCF